MARSQLLSFIVCTLATLACLLPSYWAQNLCKVTIYYYETNSGCETPVNSTSANFTSQVCYAGSQISSQLSPFNIKVGCNVLAPYADIFTDGCTESSPNLPVSNGTCATHDGLTFKFIFGASYLITPSPSPSSATDNGGGNGGGLASSLTSWLSVLASHAF